MSEKKSKLYLRPFFRISHQRLIVPVKSIYIIMTVRAHVQTKKKCSLCHCTKCKEFFITKKKEVCRSKSKNEVQERIYPAGPIKEWPTSRTNIWPT